MQKKLGNKPLVLFLAIAFGLCWGPGILYIFFGETITPILGELTITHPIAILALYAPSIAGICVYLVFGGLKGMLAKLVPRKDHLKWYLVATVSFILYAVFVRSGSILLRQPVPAMDLGFVGGIKAFFGTLVHDQGIMGGAFGWIGFLLPYLQSRIKNTLVASLITGLAFGLWVLPGYMISSVNASDTSYVLYVVQLMVLMVFMKYLFNNTQGSILIYIYAFWLFASGSFINLYYFNRSTQLLQIVFFIIVSAVLHFMIQKQKQEREIPKYPAFVCSS